MMPDSTLERKPPGDQQRIGPVGLDLSQAGRNLIGVSCLTM
jgi:hypothetical protein